MPAKRDEVPTRQQDRADEVARHPRDEVRNFELAPRRNVANDDIGDIGEWMDYPDINTNGSER